MSSVLPSDPNQSLGELWRRVQILEAVTPSSFEGASAYAIYANGGSSHTQASGVAEEPKDYGTGATLNLFTNATDSFSITSRQRVQVANGRSYMIWAGAVNNGNHTRYLQVKSFVYNSGGGFLGSVTGVGAGGFFATRMSFIPSTVTTGEDLANHGTIIQLGPGTDVVELSPVVTLTGAGLQVLNWYMYLVDIGPAPMTQTTASF